MRWLVLSFLIVSSITAAFAEGDVIGPLDWKKIRFEEKVLEKLNSSLNLVISDKKFVASINVELKAKQISKIGTGLEPGAEDSVALGKLDMEAYSIGAETLEHDLFENLKKVNVLVLLDNSVADSKKALVETIAKSLIGTIGEIQPEIKIEKVDLIPPLTPEAPWPLTKWLQEFKLPLGLVTSVAVFGLISFILVGLIFAGYRKLENRKLVLMEKQNEREDAEERRNQQSHEQEQTLQKKNPLDILKRMDGLEKGFLRLKALVKSTPDKVAGMIKQWLLSTEPGASDALAIIPQLLTMEELVPVFDFLTPDERKDWKTKLTSGLTEESVLNAEAFVAIQIVDNLLEPPGNAAHKDAQKLVSDLKLSEIVQLAVSDSMAGAMLFNILPPSQVARMVSLMPVEAISATTTQSLRITNDQIKEKAEELRSKVSTVRTQQSEEKQSMFLERAANLMREAGPAKEAVIFNTLVEAGELALVEATARQFMPSELVFKLPAEIIRELMSQMNVSARAELIVSLEGADREFLYATVGEPGSKLRELIDVEIQDVESDEVRLKRTKKNKDVILSQFVELVRTSVASSEGMSSQIQDALNAWISEKTNGQFGQGASDAA